MYQKEDEAFMILGADGRAGSQVQIQKRSRGRGTTRRCQDSRHNRKDGETGKGACT